jgi:predicted DNA repair protein MutK
MAGSSLLVLIDDIAAVLDDVAVLSKIAAKKTIGVLGDDLAVNADQVSGVRAERELPVVWAVAKGSFRNKLILVPAALAISAVAGWLVTLLLMLGGLYLCYEGFEKLAHGALYTDEEDEAHHRELIENLSDPTVDPVVYEEKKIKGAIRTDFILSGEIIVITLGTVADAAFTTQFYVVSTIAILMTAGVYGFVAGIVKLDDAGLYLAGRKDNGLQWNVLRSLGNGMVNFAPILMKGLTVLGTIAMFMVGGGILVHGMHPIQITFDNLTLYFSNWVLIGQLLHYVMPTLLNMIFGVFAGGVVLGGIRLWDDLKR